MFGQDKHLGEKLKKYQWIALLLIPLFLALFFRIQPLYVPYATTFAEEQVDTSIQLQFAQIIKEKQPGLSLEQLNQLAKEKAAKEKKQSKKQYQSAVEKIAKEYRNNLQDPAGHTYLQGNDPYQYYRYSKNVADTGMIGDEIRDGKQWDTHTVAPLGKLIGRNIKSKVWSSLPVYFSAYTYQLIKKINKDASFLSVISFMSVLMILLTLLFLFLLGKRIAGNIAGGIAALVLGINPYLLRKTVAGFFDTDAYITFFFVFIIWAFIEAFHAKTNKRKILFVLLSGLGVALFKISWTGWWIVVYLLVGSTIVYAGYLIYQLLQEKKEHALQKLKEAGMIIAGFFSLTLVTLLVIARERFFRHVYLFFTMPFYYSKNLGASIKAANNLCPIKIPLTYLYPRNSFSY